MIQIPSQYRSLTEILSQLYDLHCVWTISSYNVLLL